MTQETPSAVRLAYRYVYGTGSAVKRNGRYISPTDLVRSAPRWWRAQKSNASPLDQRIPWLAFRVIDRLEAYLRTGMRVFEFGAGGSTVFFVDRSCSVVSAEHDPEWATAVEAAIDVDADWTLHRVEPDGVDPDGDPSDPQTYVSSRGREVFRTYAETIDSYPDRWFDLVSVDGRARPACLRHAIPKVKPGGLLLLDNSDFAKYERGKDLVDVLGWPRDDLAGANPARFSRTTIWTRL